MYRTICKESRSEIVVEKSRFIANIRPVRSRSEAESFFDEVRKKYHDARHNVPLFVIGDKMQEQWSSEDGEPQGTAGAPMLQLLMNEGVTNVALVVTRYFGGIKLGTGGLVRAYSAVAKTAIADAGIVDITRGIALRYVMNYKSFERISAYAAKSGYRVSDPVYGENVSFLLTAPVEKEEAMRKAASAASGSGEQPVSVQEIEIVGQYDCQNEFD